METLPGLCIGHLTATMPVIQGGMGVGISLSGLASAVANEGGIGVIATAMIGMCEPNLARDPRAANITALRNEIRKARETTNGKLGVNIMVALTNFADMVRTSIEEGIDIIFSGAGLPLDLPSYVEPGSKTLLAPIVSSGRAARVLCTRWTTRYQYLPDAIVVEGPMAGGHLGLKRDQMENPAYALEHLVAEVLEAIEPFEREHQKTIPVVAAGGVYTGADMHRFLQLGASGVQMGTRFVGTFECDASDAFKQAYIDAREDDIVLIDSPVGMPGRALRNKFLDDVTRGVKQPVVCPYHCVITCDYTKTPYCIALALLNAKKGRLQHGFVFAGKNAYRVKHLVSVKDLFDALRNEYAQACTSAPLELALRDPA